MFMRTRTLNFIYSSCAAFIFWGASTLDLSATGNAFKATHHRQAASAASSATREGINAGESAGVKYSASRERVSGREIAGFSARQARRAQEKELTPPAGLKPVEQEAWLAMARRQGASGMGLESFYPARYSDPTMYVHPVLAADCFREFRKSRGTTP